MVSTYVAAFRPWAICISTSQLIALGFLLVSFYSVVQVFYLWSDGSKLSHRKRAFIRLIACNLLRFFWYALSSYHLLPENYDPAYINFANGYFSFFVDRISYSTLEILAHVAYLWPTALLFSSYNWTLLNWLKLYQTEKIRLKLEMGNSVGLSHQERQKKARRKMKKLFWVHMVCSVTLYLCIIALAPLHLANDVVADLPGFWGTVLSVLSPEAILASVCILGLISITFYCCRILGNLERARNSDSDKLKRHTILILMVGLSQLCYYVFVVGSQFYGVFDTRAGSASAPTELIVTHALLRGFEILHNTLIITVLAFKALSSRAPFPAKTREITSDWLTHVLRENGTIKSTTTVVAFSYQSIYGGCHFKVAKVHLTYSVENSYDPHKSMIVKLLYWDKPIYERVLLYIRYLRGSLDREVMYLTSYRVESLFYKSQWDIMTGFHLAQIYYNSEDVFNNRFGMVLQDLSKCDDGQPHGFSVNDARRILMALAEFHGSNWRKDLPPLLAKNVWPIAGYWTEKKRASVKAQVASCWERVVSNFPEEKFAEKHPGLGQLLHSRLKWLNAEFLKMCAPKYSTLCHGDFKISNLFIKPPSVNHPDGKVYVIDFQWLGPGNVAIDVVYFLYTSLRSEDLHSIPDLLRYYYDALLKFSPGIESELSWEKYMHHCNVALVDYCVYCISSKWAMMTLEDFKQYEQKVKDGLHLRSRVHMNTILFHSYNLALDWDSSNKLKAQ